MSRTVELLCLLLERARALPSQQDARNALLGLLKKRTGLQPDVLSPEHPLQHPTPPSFAAPPSPPANVENSTADPLPPPDRLQPNQSPAPSPALGPGQTPTRRSLRDFLGVVLPSASEFDAFCLDYYRDVYEQFTNGMDRLSRVTLLLQYVNNYREMLDHLVEAHKDRAKKYWHVLKPA